MFLFSKLQRVLHHFFGWTFSVRIVEAIRVEEVPHLESEQPPAPAPPGVQPQPGVSDVCDLADQLGDGVCPGDDIVTAQHCLSAMSPLTWCPRCCPCRRRSTSGGGRTALSRQTGSVPSVEASFSSPSHCTGSLCLWSVWSSLAWPDLAVRRKPSGQRVTCPVDLLSKVLLTTLTRLSWQGRFR